MNNDPLWQAAVPIVFEFDTWGNYRVYVDGELISWLYGLGCEPATTDVAYRRLLENYICTFHLM